MKAQKCQQRNIVAKCSKQGIYTFHDDDEISMRIEEYFFDAKQLKKKEKKLEYFYDYKRCTTYMTTLQTT